jgi:hypothetical protein
MRISFLILFIGLFVVNTKGQVAFSPVESKIEMSNSDLIYSSSTITLKFTLKRQVKVLPQNNFITVDSQAIQIMALKFDGYKKNTNGENLDNQKELLATYSKYELDYFSELGVEIINPNNQWVMSKSKGWFIWYFKVGKVPSQTDKQTQIQLFATTVIDGKIFIINAPIMAGDDFSKAALIVNDLMEALTIKK